MNSAGAWRGIAILGGMLFWLSTGSAADETAVSPGQRLEITLKNGAAFKGVVVTSDERIITLQADNGSRVNIYKHIIAGITNRTSGESSPSPGPRASTAAPAQQVPAPVAASSAPDTASSIGKAKPPEPSAAGALARKDTAGPAAAQSRTVTGAPAAGQPSQVSGGPATPADTASPKITTGPAKAPLAAAVSSSPPAVVPKKRSDGKSELVLKNGTSFIGSIVSESDRFLSFATSDGVTLNILRRLIKSIDGVPYVPASGLAGAPADTSSQLKRTAPPSGLAAAGEQPKADAGTKPAAPEVAHRPQPKVELKPGTSLAELIDSLKSKHPDQRAAAARRIGAMGQWASSAIPRLTSLLADSAGASALPPIETDSITVQQLLSPGFEAGRALSRIGPQGCDELKKQIRNENSLVRQRAVFGLGEAHFIQMQPQLQEALQDPDPRVRAVAANALRFNEAVPSLIEILGDPDGDVRTQAVGTLGEIRSPLAVKSLIAALKDVRPSVRARAAEALMKAKVREAVGPLSGSLTDMSSEVREKAAEALEALRDTAAVTPLLTALTDKSPGVRRSAAKALGAIRDPRAIPSLYSALNETVESVRAAVEASLKLHTEIPPLIAALDSDSPLVRENAAYILWLMTGKDLGLDKKAWLAWLGSQGKAGKKQPVPEKDGKGKKEM